MSRIAFIGLGNMGMPMAIICTRSWCDRPVTGVSRRQLPEVECFKS